jgi:cob(I)alamin adenosyltransferase
MKIYTKSGDDGTTGLFGGRRVPKTHPRVAAYGAVDELNALVGAARAHPGSAGMDQRLQHIQGLLFCVGSDLATPPDVPARGHIPEMRPEWIETLEDDIDEMTAPLPPLTSFILPAGTPQAAALHVARAACRRSERRTLAARDAGEAINPDVLVFLNRLGDWLFTAARLANHEAGRHDEPWIPPL